MKINNLKQDKGVAGLTILLSLVTMLFVIGLLVFIFSLMGGSLADSTYTEATAVSVVNETIAVPTTAGVTLAGGLARDGTCGTVVIVNGTAGTVVSSGNYTQTNCVLTNKTAEFSVYNTTYATYTYTWSADNTATEVINATTIGIAGVTDWYDIFIVISAMVVLILLTVIIITAIRGSGLMFEGRNAGNVGSA